MNAIILPALLNGNIKAPSSKSVMQRMCALALLHHGNTIIHQPGKSDDDLVAFNIIKKLGADCKVEDDVLLIKSDGKIKNAGELDFGESGLSCRMFSPVVALTDGKVKINGKGSLLRRDMTELIKLLTLLGSEVNYNSPFLPIEIQGPLSLKNIKIDGSKSSQYITGLLMAYAYAAESSLEIQVDHLVSRPYIDVTLDCLKQFGYHVSHDSYTHFYFNKRNAVPGNIEVHVEGDWSSASFFLVAGVIAGNISIAGLNFDSRQADIAILDVLKSCKAIFEIHDGIIHVKQSEQLLGFRFDATHAPDLFPILVCLAAFCSGQSVIKCVGRLINKESNRAEAIIDVFTKLGVSMHVKDDELYINGQATIKSATVASHHDHRIVMAVAITALRAEGTVTILDAEAVNKSFPDFFNRLKSLGGSVTLIH